MMKFAFLALLACANAEDVSPIEREIIMMSDLQTQVITATPTGVEVSEGCTSDNVDLLQSAKHSSLTGSTWHTIAAAVSTLRNDPSAKRARHSPEMEGLEASMSQLAGNVISGREEMTKGIKDIADAVRAEMSKIVAEVENGEKQALQDQINAGVAAFDECAAPATIDDNFETAANSKEKAHSDCRTEEKTLKGVAANKANTYDDEFPASPPSCNSNFAATYATPASMEQISTFTECVQKTADWWSAYKSSAIPAANAYKAAAIAHTDETAKCNTAQTTFETTYCSYAVHFEDTCGAYTRCYTAKSLAFQNMTKDVQTLEATHKRLFTSAKHITCLLNLLEDTSNTDKQTLLNDCLNEQIDTSSVEVTMKSAPEAADCHSVAGTVENPGGQGFATKFYNQKDWHDDAPTQAQIECVIPVSDSSQATGPPVKLDCTKWLDVAGTDGTTSSFWQTRCQNLPSSASFLKLKMGEVVDYFKPTAGIGLCGMLNKGGHEWSKDGITWRVPNYFPGGYLGGSSHQWPKNNVDGDSRQYLSFWGDGANLGMTGGCCQETYNAGGADWSHAFTMSYCSA